MHLIAIPCSTGPRAEEFAAALRAQEVEVDSVEGRYVHVPTNRPAFAWSLAEAAVDGGYSHDAEVADAVARQMNRIILEVSA